MINWRNLALMALLAVGALPSQFGFANGQVMRRPAAAFNVSYFNKLTSRQRMQFAVAAVTMRGSELSNISFTTHGRVENFGHGAKQGTWITADDFDMRRRGISYWIHLKQYYSPDHQSFTNYYSSWNGTVERGVSFQGTNSSADCVITDKQFNGIRANAYLDMLGFRVDTPLYDTTLAVYLRHALRNKWQQYSVRARLSADGPDLVVRVSTGSVAKSYRYRHYREYRLAVNRGFMPVRYREIYRSQGKVVAMTTAKVTSAKLVNGVWAPMAVKETSQNSAMPGVRSVQAVRVKRFAVRTVKPEDLRLKFPKGSRLLNLIKMRSYYKNHRGKLVPQPLYIPQSGKILRPGPSTAGKPN